MKHLKRHSRVRAAAVGLVLGGSLLAGGLYATPQAAAALGGQAVTDFSVVVSGGDLNEILPFSSTGIRRSNGTVIVNGLVTVRVTKPNSSVVTFRQRTDTDGRMRGFVYGGIVNQVGSYTLQVDPDQGTSASGTFTIKNKFDATNLTSGVLGVDRLPVSFLDQVGANSTGTARRGVSIVDTGQSTSSETYTTLATPDEVTVTLPENGLIYINYQALWKYSGFGVSNACAAIFLDENQLRYIESNSDPVVSERCDSSELYAPLVTTPSGRFNSQQSDSVDSTSNTTTGLAVMTDNSSAGTAVIFANAGTYTVSVRYKVEDGAETVSLKNRKLWVRAEGY